MAADSPSPEPVANMKSGDSPEPHGEHGMEEFIKAAGIANEALGFARVLKDGVYEAIESVCEKEDALRSYIRSLRPAAASPSIQSSPPASEIREAIDAVIEKAPLAYVAGRIIHPVHAELAAARSRLETLYREQQQEIERLREDVPTEEEVRVLLRSLSEGPPSRVLNSAILRLQRIKRGSRK